jgi:hypothetical protein
MNPNPYAPPRAEVADLDPTPAPPPAVKRACLLIIVSMVLGIVTLLPGVRTPVPGEEDVPFLFVVAIVAVFGSFTLWLLWCIVRGRNWARWGMLVFLGVGWVMVGMEWPQSLGRDPLASAIDIFSLALEAAACSLLFLGPGARWFAGLAARRRVQSATG